MTTNGAPPAPPPPAVTVRRVEGEAARGLAEFVERFDDLQSVLRCCERLVTELAADGETDDVVVEAVWTTALLSYARCFSASDTGAQLTEDDLPADETGGEIVEWHRLLLQLRDHYAAPVTNPRERFTIGVTQDADGAASGVAITSVRQPLVDDLTVRQTGAIAYALRGVLDTRIESRQKEVLEELEKASRAELDQLVELDVIDPDQGS